MRRQFALLLPALLLALCLTACGEADRSGGPARTTSTPAQVDVAALGDSITAGSPLWDPDPEVRAQLGPGVDEASQFEAHVPGVRFRNCGVWGERTDEIADRLDECARGAKTLIVQGGINDIVQGRPVADAAKDLRAMVREGTERGLRVAIAEVLPWNNGGPPAEPAIAELNVEIAKIAREEKAVLLPFHDVLIEQGEPGRMADGLTDDGNHPSVEGYRRLGAVVARTLGR
jgi:lysophospholipase L1-like esterase